MTIIGKLICSLRARFGARRVHKYVRHKAPYAVGNAAPTFHATNLKRCLRCGIVVPVKPRKRKGAE